MLRGIKPIRTIISQMLNNATDKYEIQELTNVLKWLNRAERSYDTYEMYQELKNSAERVIIIDRATQEAKVATNAQIFKLAVIKEDINHEQSLHEDPNRGVGTSHLGSEDNIREFLRNEALEGSVLGEIISRRLP